MMYTFDVYIDRTRNFDMILITDFHLYIRTIQNQTVSIVKKPNSHTTRLNQFKYSLEDSKFENTH